MHELFTYALQGNAPKVDVNFELKLFPIKLICLNRKRTDSSTPFNLTYLLIDMYLLIYLPTYLFIFILLLRSSSLPSFPESFNDDNRNQIYYFQ